MLARKIISTLIISSFVFSQNSMSGYGYGSTSYSNELSLSNTILPSFKENISLSNPSTWHNLLFTYISTDVKVQKVKYSSNSFDNFSLSSAKFIVPWKSQMAFGISFEPYLEREISIEDSTTSSFTFDDEELFFSNRLVSSGGPSLGKLSFGYKLNEFDSIGSSLNLIFGSSRKSRNLLIDGDSHLLQSRDYFSGSMIDFYFSTDRFKFRDEDISIFLKINLPISGINVEHDSYQAFIDLNDNNYHDSNDFPDLGQALLPQKTNFKNELKINSFTIGANYKFSQQENVQLEFFNWNDKGNHKLDSSIFGGYIDKKSKLSLAYVKFSKPFTKDKFNYKASIFFQNYGVKNLENINEVGLGLGVGINFGLTENQINVGYNFSNKSGIHLIDKEKLHTFSVGISIGDLWFVKRREI